MARGKGRIGTSMQLTKTKRLPSWMKKSYEERIESRDASSAKRLAKFESKGLVTRAPHVAVHACGTKTTLEPRYHDIPTRFGHYEAFCRACEIFA
jgi:hypothetical protein